MPALSVSKEDLAIRRIQLPLIIQCPFCDHEPFHRFPALKYHCRTKHTKVCPICGQHFSRLGIHLWGQSKDPKHLLALVCIFSGVSKAYPTRMRLHALERKVFNDWEYYTKQVRHP